MSIHGKVKVWKLPPDRIEAFEKNPRMDLGEPDRIEEPAQLIYTALGASNADSKKQSERVKKAHRAKKPKIIDPELYKIEKAAGKTMGEIADQFGIKWKTLRGYISKWRQEGLL